MKTTNTLIYMALCGILTQNMACSAATSVILMLDEKAAERIETLEKREATLIKKYNAQVKTLKKNIQNNKKQINQTLQAQKVHESFESIRRLYQLTHPCEEKRCVQQSYNRKPYITDQALLQENIDREDKFIAKSLDRLYKVSQTLANKGHYDQLTESFSKVSLNWVIKHDKTRRSKFQAFQKTLNQRWMVKLVKQAQQDQTSFPAIALLKWNKAASLAKSLKQQSKASSYTKQAQELRQRIKAEYRFNVYVQTLSGPLAAPTITALKKQSLPNIRFTTSRNSTTRATLSVRTASPTYRISNSQQRGSFRYTKGKEKKENPKIAKIKRKIKISQGNAARCSRTCGKPYKSCTVNMHNGSSRIIADDEVECRAVRTAQKEISDLNSQLASTPKYVEKTAYGQHSYSYTLHKHEGSSKVSYVLEFPSNARPIQRSYTLTGAVTDAEHPAYSHKDGRVSANPKDIPTQKEVFGSLQTNLNKDLKTQITKGYDQYIRYLPKLGNLSTPSGKKQRINGLALYKLLGGDRISITQTRQLDKLSGIPGAATYIR